MKGMDKLRCQSFKLWTWQGVEDPNEVGTGGKEGADSLKEETKNLQLGEGWGYSHIRRYAM